MKQYDKIIDALNAISEKAERACDNIDEELELERAYEIVADFIDDNAKR